MNNLIIVTFDEADLQRRSEECFPQAEIETLHQVLRAFLREGMIPSLRIVSSAHEYSLVIQLDTPENTLLIDSIKINSLNRYSDIGSMWINEDKAGRVRQLTSLREFMNLIRKILLSRDDVHELLMNRFITEVENSCENLAYQLAFKSVWESEFYTLLSQNSRSFWQVTTAPDSTLSDPSIFLEQWGARGHPHHPCAKTKLGFTKSDLVKYSPEFHGSAKVGLVAVRREQIYSEDMNGNGNSDPTAFLSSHFPHWVDSWKNSLEALRLEPANYCPIPVHPWQEGNKLKRLFAEPISRRDVVFTDADRLPVAATLSMRTVAPIGGPYLPHIKLPISVQATSELRDLPADRTIFGPRVSRLVSNILKVDDDLSRVLLILPEWFGVHYRAGKERPDLASNLSAVFRQSPASALRPTERSVVVAALLCAAPGSQKPLIIEIMEAAGATRVSDQLDYFSSYLDIVVKGTMALYCKYGIAFEGHQQNTLAVFDRYNRPRRMLIRDLTDVRIHEPTLTRLGLSLVAPAGMRRLFRDRTIVREQLIDTTFHLHLGELVLVLSRYWGSAEPKLWIILRNKVEYYLSEFYRDFPKARKNDSIGFLEESWSTRSWTRMRLCHNTHQRITHLMGNPLRELTSREKSDQ